MREEDRMLSYFKGLGDENRLRLIHLLMHHSLCVCEIEVLLELTQSNASRHLGVLRQQGMIQSSKEGQWVHYKVADNFVEENFMLVQYLEAGFAKEGIFVDDRHRAASYLRSGYTCQDIRRDKDLVIAYLAAQDQSESGQITQEDMS